MEHSRVEHDAVEDLFKTRMKWEHYMILAAAGQNNPEHTLVLLAREMRMFDAALNKLKGEGL